MKSTGKSEAEMSAAVEALLTAARVCRWVAGRGGAIASAAKQDRSPVTVADYASQAVVCRLLAQRFPGDRIIAEESSADLDGAAEGSLAEALLGAVRECFDSRAGMAEIRGWLECGRGGSSSRSWMLDPVDGTSGFLLGGQYAIALALAERGRLKLGLLCCPNLATPAPAPETGGRGVLFGAVRGAGAWQAALDNPRRRSAIHVNAAAGGPEVVFAESRESGHSDHETQGLIRRRLGSTREALRMDSQAKYGAVARGDASVYLRLPNPETPHYREKVWDHAAGALIVAEAGGQVTDAAGKELDFTLGEKLSGNSGVIATNGVCHAAVLAAVAAEG